jgi:hypothetical protein
MGHIVCKLPENTRGTEYRYKTISAPSLQFAADTLPSLTLANAVEDTCFGGSVDIFALLFSPGRAHWWSEQNFVSVEFASEC